MKLSEIKFLLFILILFLLSLFCFITLVHSYESPFNDPRIALLPYHQRVKIMMMEQQYRQWVDRQQLYQERVLSKIDISEGLAKRDPERYERNLREYGQKLLELKSFAPMPTFLGFEAQQKYHSNLENYANKAFTAADDFRHAYEKAREEAKNNVIKGYLINTFITAVAAVATVLTAGAASPLFVASVANFGIDTLHTAYTYYNLSDREVYDAIKWTGSEEYKFSQAVSITAKVTVGFATGQLGYNNTLQGVNTTVQVASIGSPYYNQDTNKTLAVVSAGTSIYSSAKDLTVSNPDVVSQSKNVATEIDPKYSNLYLQAENLQKWGSVMKDVSAVSNIIGSGMTLYQVFKPEDAAKVEDYKLYANVVSATAGSTSQVLYHQSAVSTLQANEKVVNDYAFTRINVYRGDVISGLSVVDNPTVGKLYSDKKTGDLLHDTNLSLSMMYAVRDNKNNYNTYKETSLFTQYGHFLNDKYSFPTAGQNYQLTTTPTYSQYNQYNNQQLFNQSWGAYNKNINTWYYNVQQNNVNTGGGK